MEGKLKSSFAFAAGRFLIHLGRTFVSMIIERCILHFPAKKVNFACCCCEAGQRPASCSTLKAERPPFFIISQVVFLLVGDEEESEFSPNELDVITG